MHGPIFRKVAPTVSSQKFRVSRLEKARRPALEDLSSVRFEVEMSEGQRKLPFLSRTRPTWARRSVAGPAPTGTGQDVSTRSTGSIDSVERPSIPSTDSFPSSPQPQAPPPPSSSAYLPQRPTTSSSRAPPARSDPAPTAAGSLTDAGLVDNLVKRIVGRVRNVPLGAGDGGRGARALTSFLSTVGFHPAPVVHDSCLGTTRVG